MIQPMKSPRRKPGTQYRSAGFVTFGGPSSISVAPGTYACAVRRIELSTGRTGLVMPIGVVTV